MPLRIAIVDARITRGTIGWGEIIGDRKYYPCHEAQLDILGSKAKYRAAFFGTGTGKTAIVPLRGYKKIDQLKRAGIKRLIRGLIISPSAKSFEASQLKQHLRGVFDDTVYGGDWYEQKQIYVGPGFEIVVRTAENDYTRVSGGQYDWVDLDECWQISNVEVFEEAVRRINIYNGDLLAVTTPNVDGWLRSKLMQPFLDGDPEYYVRQAHTRENPAKTLEEHERFLAGEKIKLGSAKYDRMYGGQFADLTGLVYELMGRKSSSEYPVIPTPDKLPSPAVRAFGSADWGYYPDPFSAHIYVHCENDIVYCVDEICGQRIQTDAIGRMLREKMDRWSLKHESDYTVHGGFFSHFFCDSSRPESAAMVRRFGVPIQNRKVVDIDAGISIVDQMMRVGRLKIFDCCKNFIKEAENCSWDEKGRPKAHAGDHSLDDVRYGVSSYMQGRQITLLPDEAGVDEAAIELATAMRLAQVESPEAAKQLVEQREVDKVRERQIYMMTADDED